MTIYCLSVVPFEDSVYRAMAQVVVVPLDEVWYDRASQIKCKNVVEGWRLYGLMNSLPSRKRSVRKIGNHAALPDRGQIIGDTEPTCGIWTLYTTIDLWYDSAGLSSR